MDPGSDRSIHCHGTEPYSAAHLYLRNPRDQCISDKKHRNTGGGLLSTSQRVPVCLLSAVIYLKAIAAGASVSSEHLRFLPSDGFPHYGSEIADSSWGHSRNQMLSEWLHGNDSSASELHPQLAVTKTPAQQQQLEISHGCTARDEGTTPSHLRHLSAPAEEEGTAFFEIRLPFCSEQASFLCEHEEPLDAPNEAGFLSGKPLNVQTHKKILRRPLMCPPGLSCSLDAFAPGETADEHILNMVQTPAEIAAWGGDEQASFRRVQQLDPTRFGPAAQYAQYLMTFTPPAQQQQQLQLLQQAIAAGVAGNPAALKRLQRRAQAAAYANSVSSHPLLQGMVRTAYTAVADALGSVSVADLVQGALRGALLTPVMPPIL